MSLPAMYPEAPVIAILSGVSLIGDGISKFKTESTESGNVKGHTDPAGARIQVCSDDADGYALIHRQGESPVLRDLVESGCFAVKIKSSPVQWQFASVQCEWVHLVGIS